VSRYSYTAKSLEGEPKSGALEAKNEHELARILEEKAEKKPLTRFRWGALPFFDRVSLIGKMMFTRNLRVMIGAGVALPRALEILAIQSKSKKLNKALLDTREEIIKGKSFSSALSKYPNIFSELFCSMIKVGEEAGTLEEVLGVLTQQMEKEHELKSKIKGAMVYPAVVILAMVGIGILMLIIVVPKLAETFNELGVELPITTRLVIAIGSFVANFWYLLPLIFLFFVFLLRAALKTKIGKFLIDTLVLKIPIVAPLIRKTNSAYTVRTLSSLIASGVPIVRSLEVISGTLGNIYYKRAIADAAEQVKKGSKLAEVLKRYENIYPILVIHMIEVGEETGETSNVLEKLADFFEEEVTNATRNLSAIIEPVVMIIIGAAVGFFAVSMIQPMYSMIQTF
jgi:type II secretory pathway component PulF